MANSNYTQVNLNQLHDLIKSMSRAQNGCQVALDRFSSAMQTLIDSGQIEGTAVSSFNNNMDTIRRVQVKFEQYCGTVTKELNGIITEEQSIESEFNDEYNNLLSTNPEDFVG